MRRKPGIIREMMNPRMTTSTGTATATSHDRPTSSRSAMKTPPTIMIGAVIIIVNETSTSICTCWTSLVLRVMSDGAPKRSTSRLENEVTRRKNLALTSRPNAMAVLAPK